MCMAYAWYMHDGLPWYTHGGMCMVSRHPCHPAVHGIRPYMHMHMHMHMHKHMHMHMHMHMRHAHTCSTRAYCTSCSR